MNHSFCKPLGILAAAAVLITEFCLLGPNPVEACSLPGIPIHEIDPAYAADRAPPSLTGATFELRRSDAGTSCGDTAFLRLHAQATDDQTPVAQLGYVIKVVAGASPKGLVLYPQAIRSSFTTPNMITLVFDADGPTEAFRLEVRAVDLNGNLSQPATVDVPALEAPESDPAEAGCSVSPGGGAVPVLAALAALLALGARRRPRSAPALRQR